MAKGVPALPLELVGQSAVLGEQPFLLPRLEARDGQLLLQCFQPPAQGAQGGEDLQQLLVDGVTRGVRQLLGQVPHGGTSGAGEYPAGGRLQAGDHLEQGGLAAAVFADQTHLLALHHPEGEIF